MGLTAAVVLVYGFVIENPTFDQLVPILSKTSPNLSYEDEDEFWDVVWDELPDRKIDRKYSYELMGSNLGIICWKHEHAVLPDLDSPQIVRLPSEKRQEEFKRWCKSKGLNFKVGFYTVGWAM